VCETGRLLSYSISWVVMLQPIPATSTAWRITNTILLLIYFYSFLWPCHVLGGHCPASPLGRPALFPDQSLLDLRWSDWQWGKIFYFFPECFGLFLSASFRYCTVVIQLPPTLYNISTFDSLRCDVSRNGGTRPVRLHSVLMKPMIRRVWHP
jgi:hypothetical protein